MTRIVLAGAALALLAGCSTPSYLLTLMPRNSGVTYTGEAVERNSNEADVIIAIDSTVYTGTWVYTTADRSYGSFWGGLGVGFGSGGGSFGSVGIGTGTVAVDNPQGREAKALLKSADGSGLRCDFRVAVQGYGGGGGMCQDDKGLMYDVQVRLKESK
jgi:hypothetical protein